MKKSEIYNKTHEELEKHISALKGNNKALKRKKKELLEEIEGLNHYIDTLVDALRSK